MIWRDIVINRKVDKVDLKSKLVNIFKLNEDNISIVEALEESEEKSLICVLTEIPGDFCSMFSFYLTSIINDDIPLIIEICNQLNCEALISNDETNDPYSMILINAEGILREVQVDSEKLDEYEEYKILSISNPC
jgi:hypothetical protein